MENKTKKNESHSFSIVPIRFSVQFFIRFDLKRKLMQIFL